MLSSESKTRQLLIETARTLFAQKGKKNVTMNDIALASGKGRRTLYLYFKSKDDVYRAVIAAEVDVLYRCLLAVFNKEMPPQKKLSEFITTHLEAVKAAVIRNGSLRSDFFRDIYEVERVRRKMDMKEIEMIRDILETISIQRRNPFVNVQLLAMMVFYAVKGLEIPYMRQTMGTDIEKNRQAIVGFVLQSIRF